MLSSSLQPEPSESSLAGEVEDEGVASAAVLTLMAGTVLEREGIGVVIMAVMLLAADVTSAAAAAVVVATVLALFVNGCAGPGVVVRLSELLMICMKLAIVMVFVGVLLTAMDAVDGASVCEGLEELLLLLAIVFMPDIIEPPPPPMRKDCSSHG